MGNSAQKDEAAAFANETPYSIYHARSRSRVSAAKDSSTNYSMEIEENNLFDFQNAAVSILHERFKDTKHECIFLNIGTGLGKTVIAREFLSQQNEGNCLFLVPTGLVEQTTNILQLPTQYGELDVIGVNTGRKYSDIMVAPQRKKAVFVVNINIRYPILDSLHKFDVIFIDEAHKRKTTCTSVALRHPKVVLLSATPIKQRYLPVITHTFRFDKTPSVIKKAKICDVDIDLTNRYLSSETLAKYLDELSIHTSYTETSLYIFTILYSSVKNETDQVLSLAWEEAQWMAWAQNLLLAFKYQIDTWKKKEPNFKRLLRAGVFAKINQLFTWFPALGTLPMWLQNLQNESHDTFLKLMNTSNNNLSESKIFYQTSESAIYIHNLAKQHAGIDIYDDIQNGDIRDLIACIESAISKQKQCPRILLRVSNVRMICQRLEKHFGSNLKILQLRGDMSARSREIAIQKFRGFDQHQCKIKTLRRASENMNNTLSTILQIGNGYLLGEIEAFLLCPRIIVVDDAGTIGFDLHRTITHILSEIFIPTYHNCVQFCGRASRLAPERTIQQPPLNLCMPIWNSTLESHLFLPAMLNDKNSM